MGVSLCQGSCLIRSAYVYFMCLYLSLVQECLWVWEKSLKILMCLDFL